MRYLFFLLCLGFLQISPSTSYGQNVSINDLSDSEKRLLIGSLHLGTCVTQLKDFRDMTKRFDPRFIKKLPKKSKGPAKYYDSSANTVISLGSNFCAVEIQTPHYDKFISTLPSILGVLGGKIKLKKKNNSFSGVFRNIAGQFKVVAYQQKNGKKQIATAIIYKVVK